MHASYARQVTKEEQSKHFIQCFRVIAFVVLLGDAARGMMWPSMWSMVVDSGGGPIWQGAAVAAFSIGRVCCSPLLGWYSERRGTKRCLKLSLCVMSLGALVYPIGEDTTWMIVVAQLLLGCGSASLGVCRGWVADRCTAQEKTAHLSKLNALLYAGFTTTPLIGSAILFLFADGLEYEWGMFTLTNQTVPAYIILVLALLAILILELYMEETFVMEEEIMTLPHDYKVGDGDNMEYGKGVMETKMINTKTGGDWKGGAGGEVQREGRQREQQERRPRNQHERYEDINLKEPPRWSNRQPSDVSDTGSSNGVNTALVAVVSQGLESQDGAEVGRNAGRDAERDGARIRYGDNDDNSSTLLVGLLMLNVVMRGAVAVVDALGVMLAVDYFGVQKGVNGAIVGVFGAVGVATLLYMPKLSHRFNDSAFVGGGLLGMLLSTVAIFTVLLAVAHGAPKTLVALYYMSVCLVYSFAFPIGSTAVLVAFSNAAVGKGSQSVVLSWFGSAGSVARIVFPVFAAFITRQFSITTTFAVLGVIECITLIVLVWALRHRHKSSRNTRGGGDGDALPASSSALLRV